MARIDIGLGLSREWVKMVQRPWVRHIRRMNRTWRLEAKKNRQCRRPREQEGKQKSKI